MDPQLHNLTLRRLQLTESSATALFETTEPRAAAPQGFVRGPFSRFARTLPADFPLRTLPATEGLPAAAAATIVDPCYWTSALPFEYELHLSDGQAPRRFALRRWYGVGASFQLSGRRTVLRGVAARGLGVDDLPQFRRDEAAVVVPAPMGELCAAADELGVVLVADVRTVGGVANIWNEYAWHGSVLAAIVTHVQLAAGLESIAAAGLFPLVALKSSSLEFKGAGVESFGFAVELGAGERPPAWIADCGRPVVAIRRTSTASPTENLRSAADDLQANLAPDFNLAGYFVGADEPR